MRLTRLAAINFFCESDSGFPVVLKKVRDLLPDLAPTQLPTSKRQQLRQCVQCLKVNVLVSRCWLVALLPSIIKFKCIRKIGRTDAYKDEDELQAVVSCLMSLPFLPAADMTQSFVNLQAILAS